LVPKGMAVHTEPTRQDEGQGTRYSANKWGKKKTDRDFVLKKRGRGETVPSGKRLSFHLHKSTWTPSIKFFERTAGLKQVSGKGNKEKGEGTREGARWK